MSPASGVSFCSKKRRPNRCRVRRCACRPVRHADCLCSGHCAVQRVCSRATTCPDTGWYTARPLRSARVQVARRWFSATNCPGLTSAKPLCSCTVSTSPAALARRTRALGAGCTVWVWVGVASANRQPFTKFRLIQPKTSLCCSTAFCAACRRGLLRRQPSVTCCSARTARKAAALPGESVPKSMHHK